jgi:hypothetical protein
MSGPGVIGDGLEATICGCREVGSCVQDRRLCGSKANGCAGAAVGCGLRVAGNKHRENGPRVWPNSDNLNLMHHKRLTMHEGPPNSLFDRLPPLGEV